MGRSYKQGLDYFPLDVVNDDKLDLIEAEFGITGWAIIIKMYRRIYSNGYYCKWSEDEQLLFSKQINVDINTINAVINRGIARNIFDNVLYSEYGILTSIGIQRRYLEIVKRRKEVELEEVYLLIDVDINIENVHINPKNDDVGTGKERKGKESKGEESKIKEQFEIFRKKYPGTKRGLNTEYDNFKKKNQNYKEIVDLLLPAIETQIEVHAEKIRQEKFCPEWKHLQTWINNKSWEEETVTNDDDDYSHIRVVNLPENNKQETAR